MSAVRPTVYPPEMNRVAARSRGGCAFDFPSTGTMGAMTRPSRAPRTAPPYRQPVARGQSYPPLGFTADGAPQYQYQPPTPAAAPPVTPPPVEPPTPMASPPKPPQDPKKRMLGGLAAVLVFVLAVAAALTFFSRDDDNQFAERSAPPATQPLDDPYLDDLEDPGPSADPNAPSAPRRTTPGAPGATAPTVYEVTTESPTAVVFLSRGRMTVGDAPGGPWVQSTVTYGGQARITLLVPEGEAASCRITIDGEEVATQQIEASTSVRLLTCESG